MKDIKSIDLVTLTLTVGQQMTPSLGMVFHEPILFDILLKTNQQKISCIVSEVEHKKKIIHDEQITWYSILGSRSGSRNPKFP